MGEAEIMKVAIISTGKNTKKDMIKVIKVLQKNHLEVILLDNAPPYDLGSQILKAKEILSDRLSIIEKHFELKVINPRKATA